ncbi:MAG: DUF4340 domain-containing protein [Anaerolineae bacterium]|nr:DUF4340 domain-containing protein [Anaerolineae bacterium]
MNKRTVQLLVLAAVFIALLALVQVTSAPQDNGESQPRTLLDVDPQQIRLIRVQRVVDGAATVLERDAAGAWAITSTAAYRDAPGEDGAMRELPTYQDAADVVAIAVDTIRLRDDFESSRTTSDLASFCLSPQPVYRLRVAMADGAQHLVEIGCANPQDTAYYVALRDEPAVWLAHYAAIDALTSIVDEPPYLFPTPTPTPSE